MPTISSIARQNYLMFQYAQKNGNSLFGSAAAGKSLPVGRNYLWGSYRDQAASVGSTLSGLMGIRSNLSDMRQTYDTTAKAFRLEFDSAMDDLAAASKAIKSMDFDVGGPDAVTATTNDDGTTTVTKSDELREALKGIEDFASKYNAAIDFFHDNAGVSKHMGNMAKEFSDTTYRASSLAGIGLVVDKTTGTMKIDEDILTKALTESPNRVANVLGRDGLAGKADRHVSFARSQAGRLFPSVASALSGAYRSSSAYSGNSLLRLSHYASVGSFLNTFI